jgi:aspartate/methionine/tyrosine aminotransferase
MVSTPSRLPDVGTTIFTAVAACVRPGDEVLVFAPVYDCYGPAVTLAAAGERLRAT